MVDGGNSTAGLIAIVLCDQQRTPTLHARRLLTSSPKRKASVAR